MALAALILSIFALIVSIASAIFYLSRALSTHKIEFPGGMDGESWERYNKRREKDPDYSPSAWRGEVDLRPLNERGDDDE